MSRHGRGWRRTCLCLTVAVACESNANDAAPVEPAATVLACTPGSSIPVSLPIADVPALTARGGYVAELRVDRTFSRNEPPRFRRITDALAEARRIRRENDAKRGPGCRITILVAAGEYVGETAGVDSTKERLPLLFDMRDVTLRGSYTMPLDSAGRARGPAVATGATTLTANPRLAIVGGTTQTGLSEPMILVNSENGDGGDGAVIEGLVLRSGHATGDTSTAGKGILTFRAANLVVQHNSFEGNFTERVDLRGGSAVVRRNFSTGPGGTCDLCVAGPGVFDLSSNTIRDGGIPGILVVPATVLPAPAGVSQFFPPSLSFVAVDITNNEVSGHQRVPVGVGIRLATIGIGAPNVVGTSQLRVQRNYVHHNRFGIIVEAGFPVAGSALRGDAMMETSGNVFASQCQTDFYASLTRHTAGLGLANQPYARGSSYRFTLGTDLAWDRAWYANAAGFANTITVNGTIIAPGVRVAYDPARSCP